MMMVLLLVSRYPAVILASHILRIFPDIMVYNLMIAVVLCAINDGGG